MSRLFLLMASSALDELEGADRRRRDSWRPEPLGSGPEIRARLGEWLGDRFRWSISDGESAGHARKPERSAESGEPLRPVEPELEFRVGPEPESGLVEAVSVRVGFGPAAEDVLLGLCDALGWVAYDASTGEFLS